MQYAIPMYESERGWGAKIDGYVGPFDTIESAETYRTNYNREYNSESRTPDYYIMALEPVPYHNQICDYEIQSDLLQTELKL